MPGVSALPVRAGRVRASAGKSHSWETPTTNSPAPTANRISVPLGTREMIRMRASVAAESPAPEAGALRQSQGGADLGGVGRGGGERGNDVGTRVSYQLHEPALQGLEGVHGQRLAGLVGGAGEHA